MKKLLSIPAFVFALLASLTSPAQAQSNVGAITPPIITANQNDYQPTGITTCAILRISTNASLNITGIYQGPAWKTLYVVNVGTQTATLTNLDSNSAAANRFSLGASASLPANTGIVLQYDATQGYWVGVTGGGNTADPTTTRGDIIVRGASGLTRVALPGTGGYLVSNGTDLVASTDYVCMLRKGTDQSVANNSNDTLTFGASDVEVYDPAGMHSTSSNTDRITVPTGGDGTYILSSYQRWDGGTGGATLVAISFQHFNSGGTRLALTQTDWPGSGDHAASCIFRAASGDYFTTLAYQNTGSTKTIEGNNADTSLNSTFSAARLAGQ